MKKREFVKSLLCVALALLLVLSFAACKSQVDEQDSTPPTSTTTPTEAPTSTPEPTPPIPYTDVPSDAYYYNAVVWAYKNGIVSDGAAFEPDSTCARAQVLTFIWQVMGSPEPQTAENPFSDISPDDWCYKPALWAYENGVSSNTTFSPGNPCTNAEAITFIWRANGEPAAAVYSGSVSLANPDQYYARAVAWAEAGGMFAEVDFDPAAPCSRANLMTYLYWATEQWTLSEEDKNVQAEYEQIINDAQLYEVHGSGLLYADYIDVEGDGKVELLTIETSGDKSGYHEYEITATLYADMDGHAGKSCEKTFSWSWHEESLYICKSGNQVCLRETYYQTGASTVGDTIFKIENGAFEIGESFSVSYASEKPEYMGITESEYNALDQKYTDAKGLLSYDRNSGVSVHDRGLLPDPSAVMQEIYAAVLNGDFSAFAGNYKGMNEWVGDIALSKDGIVTGRNTSQKPISITVEENGRIYCIVKSVKEERDGYTGQSLEYYYICPVGVDDAAGFYYVQGDLTKVRIFYGDAPAFGVGAVAGYTKTS